MRRIAYIPARSGSKGVPQKNIRQLCGRPLMGWMVEAALKTGLFDRVMVSTDTEEFAQVARQCGAWVPFLRDSAVAKDTTPTIDTVCSDKVHLEEMGETFDTFCLLQTTAPLCRSEDIAGAVALFEEKHAGVVSVAKRDIPLGLLRFVDSDGNSIPVINSRIDMRRQDESAVYQLNGAIYVNAWSEVQPGLQFGHNPCAYVMDENLSVDIDSFEDFKRAERILQKRMLGKTIAQEENSLEIDRSVTKGGMR